MGAGVVATQRQFPVIPAASVPLVTAALMAEVDSLAVNEFGIGVRERVEQAGSHLAELVRAELGGDLCGRRVIVAVGQGDKGAGGLAAARHLANRGASVRVILAQPVSRLSEAGRSQLATLLAMAVDCCVAIYDVQGEELDRELAIADATVDAILGHQAAGTPRDGVLWLIDRVTRASTRVISLDLPSGIDTDSGEASSDAVVTATATLALSLPKRGLFRKPGSLHAGRVFLGDVGIPAAIYRQLGVDPGVPFAAGRIVLLEGGE
jgi:hydroxyethylthiazole kinase-like uncharacterized protein yjeF